MVACSHRGAACTLVEPAVAEDLACLEVHTYTGPMCVRTCRLLLIHQVGAVRLVLCCNLIGPVPLHSPP